MQRDELKEKFLKSHHSPYKKRCDIVNGIIEVEAKQWSCDKPKRKLSSQLRQ